MPQEVKFLDLMASKHVWAFGGMRTLPEPHLLAPDEAENAKDCDVSSGALKPAKKLAKTADVAGNWTFTRLKDRTGVDADEWPSDDNNISYVHWNDNVVWAYDNIGSTRPKIYYNEAGLPTYYLGITPPNIVGNGTAGEAQARNIYNMTWWRGSSVIGAGDYTNEANNNTPDDVPLILPPDDSGYTPTTGDNFSIEVDSDCTSLLFHITTAAVAAIGTSYSFQYKYRQVDGTWENVSDVSDGTNNLQNAGYQILSWTAPTSPAPSITDGKIVYRAELTFGSAPATYPKAGRIWQIPDGYTGNPTYDYPFKGKYKYKLTYVNETRSVESAPQSPNVTDAAIVVDLVDMAAESIVINDITNPPYLSGSDFYAADPSGGAGSTELPVEYVYLYRTVGDGDTYYYLTKAAPAGSGGGPLVGFPNWEDTTADIDLVLNKEMDAELNYLPGYLDDGGGTFVLGGVTGGTNIKGIEFHDGRFFSVGGGASGSPPKDLSVIFWSRPDNPHAWPLQQFLKLPATIQGLFSTDMGLIAFTEQGPYILYPGEWDPNTFTKKYIPKKIPGNWDCRSIQACCMTPYGVMWPSRNAIVVWNGAGEPKDLTTSDLGNVPLDSASYLSAQWYKQQYLLFSNVGTLILDFRKTGKPQARLYGWDGESSVGAGYQFKSSYYDPEGDKVYVLTNDSGSGDIWEWEGGTGTHAQTYMSLEYKTGEYGGETMERLKYFDRVEIGSDTTSADAAVSLIVDESAVASGTLSNSGRDRDVVFFPVNQTGHKAQLTLTGRADAIYDAVLYFYPDSLFSQDTIFHYIQVTTNASTAISLYVDGNSRSLTTQPATTSAGMHHVFFGNSTATNIRGRHVQVRWTNAAVTDIRLCYSEEKEFTQQRIWHGCKVTVADSTACTVKLYMDGTLKTTSAEFSAAGEYDVFFPANTRGVLPQWTASASNVVNVTWISDEEKTFGEQRIWNFAKVTCSGADVVTLYLDGAQNPSGTTYTLSAAGEYDCHFTPSLSQGRLPQFTSTSSNVTKVHWDSSSESEFADRRIWHYAKVTTDGTDTVKLYMDGTLKTTSSTIGAAGEHAVFFPANTTGRRPQVTWSGSNVRNVEWVSEPDGSYKDRTVIHGVKCMVNTACTVYIYVDGSLNKTYTASLYRTGEHTIYCSSNTHGRLFQLQWTANGVDDESIEWMVQPDSDFGERLLVKGVNVAWDGDLSYDLRVDGTQKASGTLSGTVGTHTSDEIELLPGAIGYVPQFIVEDLSTTEEGYLHKAEWNVEKEPPAETTVNSLTGTQRGYVYRVGVVYQGSVTFKAYLDDVLRSELSTSLTTYDSTDWQTVFLEANPASGLPIASKLVWDNEGAGFVKQVIWDVAPDRRMEETIPPPGTPGRYYLKGFYVTYIGAGTLNIYLGGSSSATVTQSLSSVTSKTRVHYYFPAGTFANVVQYDYSETSKNSLFVFNVEWIGSPMK